MTWWFILIGCQSEDNKLDLEDLTKSFGIKMVAKCVDLTADCPNFVFNWLPCINHNRKALPSWISLNLLLYFTLGIVLWLAKFIYTVSGESSWACTSFHYMQNVFINIWFATEVIGGCRVHHHSLKYLVLLYITNITLNVNLYRGFWHRMPSEMGKPASTTSRACCQSSRAIHIHPYLAAEIWWVSRNKFQNSKFGHIWTRNFRRSPWCIIYLRKLYHMSINRSKVYTNVYATLQYCFQQVPNLFLVCRVPRATDYTEGRLESWKIHEKPIRARDALSSIQGTSASLD